MSPVEDCPEREVNDVSSRFNDGVRDGKESEVVRRTCKSYGFARGKADVDSEWSCGSCLG